MFLKEIFQNCLFEMQTKAEYSSHKTIERLAKEMNERNEQDVL